MIPIHVFGSSHVSQRHNFPQCFKDQYDIMEEPFKNKFCIGVIEGVSGGQYLVNYLLIKSVNLNKLDCKLGSKICVHENKNPFHIISKPINALGVPSLVKIGPKLWPWSPNGSSQTR